MDSPTPKSLCVFCGSKPGKNPHFSQVATQLGHQMALQKIELVYGGAKVGLMGILADAVLEKSGNVFGVIPRHIGENEVAHDNLTELRIVDSMHQRKAIMAERAQVFVSLPGGFGTLDETFEILTWRQLGLHQKPVILLNIEGYYDPLLGFLQQTVAMGFVKKEHFALLQMVRSVEELLTKFF